MVSDESLLLLLKTGGPASAPELAGRLGVTPQGLRRRLEALRAEGYAADEAAPAAGAGRPSRRWRLTAAGHARFPDAHDQVAVEMIAALRARFGEAGLEAVIADREAAQRARYAAALGSKTGLRRRVEALARLRSAEGYMAEVAPQADGSLLLIEHHCPICAAATACQGFCRSELAIFRAVLGAGASVEREQHLPSGDRRCVYRVREVDVEE